jgi:hypothetical protein
MGSRSMGDYRGMCRAGRRDLDPVGAFGALAGPGVVAGLAVTGSEWIVRWSEPQRLGRNGIEVVGEGGS